VGGFDVGLGDEEVAFDHIEGGVAQGGLERVDVAVVAQVLDGECVAEAVGIDVGDAGALAETVEVGAELAAVDAGAASSAPTSTGSASAPVLVAKRGAVGSARASRSAR